MKNTLEWLQKKYNKLGLSRRELAKELGISLSTLDRMIANKEALPKYRKVGGRYFFPLEEIAKFLDEVGGDDGK